MGKSPHPAGLPSDFVAAIERSIQDELSDIAFYSRIALEAPSRVLQELVTSIIGDEYAHVRIQSALIGQDFPPMPSPAAPSPPPSGWVEDVSAAVLGELGAVARYAHLAAIAPTFEIRYLLTSILGDEYGHARTWTALLVA